MARVFSSLADISGLAASNGTVILARLGWASKYRLIPRRQGPRPANAIWTTCSTEPYDRTLSFGVSGLEHHDFCVRDLEFFGADDTPAIGRNPQVVAAKS